MRLLHQRTELAEAVCEALLATPDDYDTDGPRSAYRTLYDWVEQHVEPPLQWGVRSGMDDMIVPANRGHVADLLSAANDVCGSLELLWTASLLDYDRDIADITAGLQKYRRCLTLEPEPFDADEDELDEDEDEDEDDEFQRMLADGTGQDPDPDDGWDEVAEIADAVFDVWVVGSETAWARYAWGALRRAGLTRFETQVQRARVVCRLIALRVAYHEFCVRAFDQGYAGAWPVDDATALGEYPRIDSFVLGLLAGTDGVDADEQIDYVFEEGAEVYAFRELVRSEYPAVVCALKADLGLARLFASLWASSQDEVRYPLSDAAMGWAVNTGINGEKLTAYQWIDEGMPL
ncbi:hypothetical protein [Pseudonocardia aurantiaca]|uniref:DUF4240 domain-containing protein n=1 Tax=Pseudonocardia aurantiaca TaxID=75290 RepID=A0ABW4FXU3_9PSEU